jgi:hypothetical protein
MQENQIAEIREVNKIWFKHFIRQKSSIVP